MDHFALPDDELCKASRVGKLHRNFMGYTTQETAFLLGLGVSSISDTGNAFAQNTKTLHDYNAAINRGELAIAKGYFMTEEDKAFKKYILDISCKGATTFSPKHIDLLKQYTFPRLSDLAADELVEWDYAGIKLTSEGRYFIINICAAFDLHLQKKAEYKIEEPKFSKAI